MERAEINIIIKKLTDINIELIRKYGTDAYEIRCKIFDIKDELSKLHQHDVSGQSEQLVCICKNRQDQFKRGDIWICGDCEEEIKQTNCH